MGSKRIGLARTQALIESLKRELNLADSTLAGQTITDAAKLTGQVAATVTAAGTSAALSEALICPVDSTNNAHEVKMFNATAIGQICFVVNVDTSQDAVIRNVADDANLVTLGEGVGCVLVATATGDNWYPVGLGS